jgi:hypothetical protein
MNSANAARRALVEATEHTAPPCRTSDGALLWSSSVTADRREAVAICRRSCHAVSECLRYATSRVRARGYGVDATSHDQQAASHDTPKPGGVEVPARSRSDQSRGVSTAAETDPVAEGGF